MHHGTCPGSVLGDEVNRPGAAGCRAVVTSAVNRAAVGIDDEDQRGFVIDGAEHPVVVATPTLRTRESRRVSSQLVPASRRSSAAVRGR